MAGFQCLGWGKDALAKNEGLAGMQFRWTISFPGYSGKVLMGDRLSKAPDPD